MSSEIPPPPLSARIRKVLGIFAVAGLQRRPRATLQSFIARSDRMGVQLGELRRAGRLAPGLRSRLPLCLAPGGLLWCEQSAFRVTTVDKIGGYIEKYQKHPQPIPTEPARAGKEMAGLKP